MSAKLKIPSVFFIGLLLIVLLPSCYKEPTCKNENQHTGIILNWPRIPCVLTPPPNFTGSINEFIINDDTAFKQFFSAGCELPVIDFKTQTLLGFDAGTRGCTVKFIREVLKIESENRYHYKVISEGCGTCRDMAWSYHWVLVPKLPDGWTVTFEAIETERQL